MRAKTSTADVLNYLMTLQRKHNPEVLKAFNFELLCHLSKEQFDQAYVEYLKGAPEKAQMFIDVPLYVPQLGLCVHGVEALISLCHHRQAFDQGLLVLP